MDDDRLSHRDIAMGALVGFLFFGVGGDLMMLVVALLALIFGAPIPWSELLPVLIWTPIGAGVLAVVGSLGWIAYESRGAVRLRGDRRTRLAESRRRAEAQAGVEPLRTVALYDDLTADAWRGLYARVRPNGGPQVLVLVARKTDHLMHQPVIGIPDPRETLAWFVLGGRTPHRMHVEVHRAYDLTAAGDLLPRELHGSHKLRATGKGARCLFQGEDGVLVCDPPTAEFEDPLLHGRLVRRTSDGEEGALQVWSGPRG